MTLRHRLPALLLAIDWLVFLLAFAWTCKAQHSLLWWLRLDWTGWLGEFGEMAQLGSLSAGTLWILWLALSVLLTSVWLFLPETKTAAAPVATPSADTARRQLATNSSMADLNPDLKEKILRLHQSLDKI